jgi:hypothetical protein
MIEREFANFARHPHIAHMTFRDTKCVMRCEAPHCQSVICKRIFQCMKQCVSFNVDIAQSPYFFLRAA